MSGKSGRNSDIAGYRAAWQSDEGNLGLHSFRRANITVRQEVGARSHRADPVSGRCRCVRASFESGHHPPRFVRGQSILQRPFGSGAQKRRLAGVDRAWW